MKGKFPISFHLGIFVLNFFFCFSHLVRIIKKLVWKLLFIIIIIIIIIIKEVNYIGKLFFVILSLA